MNETREVLMQPAAALENIYCVDTVYFEFEEDFVEDNVRCIPMIVRFKLDACGIKLKLHEWCKMNLGERKQLAEMACSTPHETMHYRRFLRQLVMKRTGATATDLPAETAPDWANTHALPAILLHKAAEFGWHTSLQQWRRISNLQRFVLLKLCKPGHENVNFPKAYTEFGLA